jgi:cytochrome c5
MRALYVAAVHLSLVMGALTLSGCGSSDAANAQLDFAPGAFPPTLSAEEYHANSWTREDCLTCHQQGVQNAPKMRHVSLPEIAAGAKCRTCHVLIADEESP